MIAIAVDDEELMLRALVRAVSASPDVKEVVRFSSAEKALDYVKENKNTRTFKKEMRSQNEFSFGNAC